MKIFNLKFIDPQKSVIKLLKDKLRSMGVVSVHVSAQFPTPAQKQYDKIVVVESLGFSSMETQVLREYSLRFIVEVKNISRLEYVELCEKIETAITSLRGEGVKYVELESSLEEEYKEKQSFKRVYNTSVLVQASTA